MHCVCLLVYDKEYVPKSLKWMDNCGVLCCNTLVSKISASCFKIYEWMKLHWTTFACSISSSIIIRCQNIVQLFWTSERDLWQWSMTLSSAVVRLFCLIFAWMYEWIKCALNGICEQKGASPPFKESKSFQSVTIIGWCHNIIQLMSVVWSFMIDAHWTAPHFCPDAPAVNPWQTTGGKKRPAFYSSPSVWMYLLHPQTDTCTRDFGNSVFTRQARGVQNWSIVSEEAQW